MTNEIKLLMALCYKYRSKLPRYEVVMHFDEDFFALRIYFTELNYLYISYDYTNKLYLIRDLNVSKSFYHPSTRCGLLNKYFKKYRIKDWNKKALVPYEVIEKFFDSLEEIDFDNRTDVTFSKPYRGIAKASGLY